jgi:hypothetical protein
MTKKILNLRGDINVEGNFEVSGRSVDSAGGKKTGEKFLGVDVYIKEHGGTLNGKHLSDFFPNSVCKIVDYGGDYNLDKGRVPIQYMNYVSGVRIQYGTKNLEFAFNGNQLLGLRIWVKYTQDIPAPLPDFSF